MKRSLVILVFMAAIGAALAQAPFTIVRPADGSKVREKVHVLIPKNSIPQGGYIGIFLNGKFLEAVTPPLAGKYYDYVLDTKGRQIADGKVNLEAVLFVDYNKDGRLDLAGPRVGNLRHVAAGAEDDSREGEPAHEPRPH